MMVMLRFAAHEAQLKWIALGLGIFSTIAIIRDWYPYTMIINLPFCLIWGYCAWLHRQWQLKWVNILFILLYLYGLAEYYFFSEFCTLPTD